jgi:hypothetical protein
MSMSMKMKRFLPAAGILAVVLLLPALSLAQTPNLTGTWAFDAAKSQVPDMGGRGGMGGGGDIAIKHEGTTVSITTTRTGRDGEPTTNTETFSTDGKPTTVEGRMGASSVTAKWEGRNLMVTTSRQTQRGDFSTAVTYSLSADGKVLTVSGSMRNREGGETAYSRVYNKK